MTRHQQQVLEFSKTFECYIGKAGDFPDKEITDLRENLIAEEFNELKLAIAEHDPIKVADALGDLQYVLDGTAIAFGWDMEPICDEVHRSNMTKKMAGGTILRSDKGKVIKPNTYSRVDLKPILDKQQEE